MYLCLRMVIPCKIPGGKLDPGQPVIELGVPPEVVIVPADVEPEQRGQSALLLIHLNHLPQTGLRQIIFIDQ